MVSTAKDTKGTWEQEGVNTGMHKITHFVGLKFLNITFVQTTNTPPSGDAYKNKTKKTDYFLIFRTFFS